MGAAIGLFGRSFRFQPPPIEFQRIRRVDMERLSKTLGIGPEVLDSDSLIVSEVTVQTSSVSPSHLSLYVRVGGDRTSLRLMSRDRWRVATRLDLSAIDLQNRFSRPAVLALLASWQPLPISQTSIVLVRAGSGGNGDGIDGVAICRAEAGKPKLYIVRDVQEGIDFQEVRAIMSAGRCKTPMPSSEVEYDLRRYP